MSTPEEQLKKLIEVELPTGTIIEFPEGTAPEVIQQKSQFQFAAEMLETEVGMPAEHVQRVLAPFENRPVPIPELMEKGTLTYNPGGNIQFDDDDDDLTPPIGGIPEPDVVVDIEREMQRIQEGIPQSTHEGIRPSVMGENYASQMANYAAKMESFALEMFTKWVAKAPGITGFPSFMHSLTDEEQEEVFKGAGEAGLFSAYKTEIEDWSKRAIEESNVAEHMLATGAGFVSPPARQAFKWGSEIATRALRNGYWGVASLADKVGGERAGAAFGKWALGEGGKISKAFEKAFAGAGAFGGFSAMLGEDWDQVGKQAIVGAMTMGAGGFVPEKLFGVQMAPLRLAAESLGLATGHGLTEYGELKLPEGKEFAEVFAQLAIISLINRGIKGGGDFSRAQIRRWQRRIVDQGVADGWYSPAQERVLNQVLDRDMPFGTSMELTGFIKEFGKVANPMLMKRVYREIFEKMGRGEKLGMRRVGDEMLDERLLINAFRIYASEPGAIDAFVLPREGDVGPAIHTLSETRPGTYLRVEPQDLRMDEGESVRGYGVTVPSLVSDRLPSGRTEALVIKKKDGSYQVEEIDSAYGGLPPRSVTALEANVLAENKNVKIDTPAFDRHLLSHVYGDNVRNITTQTQMQTRDRRMPKDTETSVAAAGDIIAEAKALPRFLEHLPQKGMLTMSTITQAMSKAAKEAGMKSIPEFEQRFVSSLLDSMVVRDEAAFNKRGDIIVPHWAFVRAVLEATPHLPYRKVLHDWDMLYGSRWREHDVEDFGQGAIDAAGGRDARLFEPARVRRFLNMTENQATLQISPDDPRIATLNTGVLLHESPIVHGVTERQLNVWNVGNHAPYHKTGKYMFHTNYAYDPSSREYYVLEVQNDHARELGKVIRNQREAKREERPQIYRQELLRGYTAEMRRAMSGYDNVMADAERLRRQEREYLNHLEDIRARQEPINAGAEVELIGEIQRLRTAEIAARTRAQAMLAEIKGEWSDDIGYDRSKALMASYLGLGIADPAVHFYRRALQESLRHAAQQGAEYLFVPHANTMAHIQRWGIDARMSEAHKEMILNPDFDLVQQDVWRETSYERVVNPIYERYKKHIPDWLQKTYSKRNVQLVRKDHDFLWWRVPVRDADAGPAYTMSVPRNQRGFLDISPMLLKGFQRLAEQVVRGMDSIFPSIPPPRGPREGESFEEMFHRERLLQDVRGFSKFHANWYTMIQIRDMFGRQVPELEAYTRDMQEKVSPFRARWQERANERLYELHKLSVPERTKLEKLMWEEVLASRTSERHFTQQEIDRYELADNTHRIYREIKSDFRQFLDDMETAMLGAASRRMQQEEYSAYEAETRETFAELRKRPYVPFSRFGKYYVQVTDTNTRQALEFYAFDKRRDARRAQAALEERFAEMNDRAVNLGIMEKESLRSFIGLPADVAKQMRKIAREDDLDVRKSDVELMVKQLVPSGDFPKRMLKRKALPGFSTDLIRVYADYFHHGTNHLMRLTYGDVMRGHIKRLEKRIGEIRATKEEGQRTLGVEKVRNYMAKHFEYMWNPGNELAGLRAALFDWFLGYNPSSAMVNLTQVPLATYPYLATRHGDRAAVSEIGRAYKDIVRYLNTGKGLTGEEQRALAKATAENIITESFATELAGTAEGHVFAKGMFKGRGKSRALLNLIHTYAPKMFTMSEQFNRRVTFLASFRLERAKSPVFSRVYKRARSAVEWTQGEYARWNRPAIMRGKKSVIFLFQMYTQHMLALTAHDPAAGRFLATLGVLGGITALPFIENLMDAYDLAMNAANKDSEMVDVRKALREALVELDVSPTLIMRGIGGMGIPMPFLGDMQGPTLDISTRLSLGNILPTGSAMRELVVGGEGSAIDALGALAKDVPGAAMSVPVSIAQALGSDSPYRLKALERGLPNFLKYPTRAYRYATEGKETSLQGDVLLEFDTPEAQTAAAIKTMLGFGLTELNEEYGRRQMIREHEAFYAARVNSLVARLLRAVNDGDKSGKAKVLKEIRQLNQKASHPSMKISAEQLERSIHQRRRNQLLREKKIGRTTRERALSQEVNPLFQ